MKKTIGVLAVIALTATGFLKNNSTEAVSKDFNLISLVSLNEANANGECPPTSIPNGRCGLTGRCYWGSSPVTCDAWESTKPL